MILDHPKFQIISVRSSWPKWRMRTLLKLWRQGERANHFSKRGLFFCLKMEYTLQVISSYQLYNWYKINYVKNISNPSKFWGTQFSDKEFLQMSLVQTVFDNLCIWFSPFPSTLGCSSHRPLPGGCERQDTVSFLCRGETEPLQAIAAPDASVLCRWPFFDLAHVATWQILIVNHFSGNHSSHFESLEVLWSLPKGIGGILHWTQSRSGEVSGFHDPGATGTMIPGIPAIPCEASVCVSVRRSPCGLMKNVWPRPGRIMRNRPETMSRSCFWFGIYIYI